MFHMLSYFDLKSGVSLEEFKEALLQFDLHLQGLDFVESNGLLDRQDRLDRVYASPPQFKWP